MNQDIIEQIAKKRGVSPEYVRKKIDEVISDMWEKRILQGIFSDIPSPEQFITLFAFLISSMIK